MLKPRSLFAALIAVMAVSFFPGSASASNFGGCVDLGGTINVDTTTDEYNTPTANGTCSLREAITGANDPINVGARTINLPAGTYTLSRAGTGEELNVTGDLDSTRATTIVGAGARTTTISANSIDRVVDVSATGNLTMSGVTVRQGSLTTNGTIGGGIRVLASGTLSLTDSTVTANVTSGNSGNGGGINNAGTLNLTRVLVSGNSTTGNGGGLGGGIYTTTGTATLTNVTITGNLQSGSGTPQGAGMRVDGGTASLTNVTITNNTAGAAGSVSGISQAVGTVSLRNTIVATPAVGVNCGGTIGNTANNLDSGTTCGFTTLNGSKSSAAPALGALANNGGPTDTHSIPSSPTVNPARDAGTATSAPTNDQRSAGRDAIPDMGAYEACGVSPTVTNPSAQSVTYGQSAVFTAAASGRGTVQWEVSTDSGGSWNPVAGGTSPTLTLTKPTVSQTGNLYRANFTGTGCTGTVTTTSASLTVTAKNLTISGAVANNRAYDATNTATVSFGSATLVGVEAGDTVTINSSGYSATFNNKDVGNGKPVTVIGVALSGAQAGNYTVSQPTGLTANITPKALTLSGAVAQNKVYNATTAATVDFTGASLNGVESGETVTFNSSGYSASFNNKNVGNGKAVTVSGVTLGGSDAGNYTLTQPSLTANITPKDTTGSFTANNKVYDGNDNATINTATVDAKETSDTVNLTGTAKFDNKNVGNGKTVTLNTPSLTGADAGNYNLTTVSTTTANITAKNLTISGAVAQNKVYNGTTAATVNFGSASLNGVVGGDTVTIDSSSYSANFNNKNVGNTKPVTVTGVALGGTDGGNYTVSQPTGLTANITAKGLTITGAVANNKVYDRLTTATVNFTGASLSGVESGDTVTINSSGYSASFANKNAANGKPVTVTGVALAGADATNYTLTQPTGLTADITPKDTTGTFTANNKTYDGTNSATIKTESVDGKISGDTVNLTGTPTFDNKNVGNNKTVTLNSPSLTGADAGNYNLTTVGTTDANVSRKTLTMSGAAAQNKVYNATTAATVDFSSASLNGVETVDAGQVAFNSSGYSASFNNKNVGNSKPVTVSGVTLTGAEAGNYSLTQPTGLTANITPKDTTGSFTANNKVYDGTDSATINTATVDAKETSDTVNLTGTAKFADKNVGTGKTVTLTSPSLTGADAGNYNLTTVSTTTADITPKDTTGSFTANNKVYDGTDSATIDSATVDAKETGDTVNLAGTANFDNKNVGNGKTVTLNSPSLTGADASNYNLTTVSTTTANITPKNLTIDDAVANDKTYDGTDAATVDFTGASLDGVESGDTVTIDSSSYSATFNNADVGDDKPVTVTGVALGGADGGNYTVSQPTGLTADITGKNLTITGASANNKTYDGTDAATVDFTGASLDGVESGDTVTIDSTGYGATFDNKNVGTAKPVTVTGVALGGADAGNYSVTQPSGLTADITAKGLTISGASANNRTYNGNNNATVDFTGASLDGVESGDTVTIDSTSYGATFDNKNVGTAKPVTVTGVALGGADAGNYSVTQPSGLTADITPKDTTGSFTAENKAYDGTDAATIDTATVDGKESGDTVDLTGTATFDNKNVGNGKTVTLTSPSLTGADAGNYNLTTVSTTTANITAKGLTISGASANNRAYNGNNNATVDFTGASLNGVESGDTVTIDSSAYSATFNNKNVGTAKPVTVTGVALGGADAGNYTVSQPTGLAADITPKDTTGSFTANNKVYDGTNSVTIDTATVDAKESGDTVNLTGTATFDDENVGDGKTVTLGSPSLTGADASNYNLTTVSTTTADITPKGLTISGASANNKVYNGDNSATVDFTGASLNGVESGDTVTIDSTGYSATFNNENVGNSKPVTVTGVDLDGADAGNYSVSQPSGLTANITPKGLTISGASANSRAYNGSNNATVDFTGASLNGVESGDTVTINSSGYSATFNNKNVGTSKPVTVTGVTLGGADAGNYTVSQPSGLTADITPKDTTGSFTANNKAYDGNNSATVNTATVDAKESADTVNLTGTATFANENVGNGKTVTLGSPSLTGADASNYNLTTVSTTTANITAKNLTISGASANNRAYNGNSNATVDFTGASLNGVESGDTVTIDSTGYSATFNNKNVGNSKPVTVSGVALGGADAGNYTVSQPSGLTANITAKGLTISGAAAQTKTYNGSNAATVNFGSASLNGVESGDTVAIDSSGYSATFNNENVGTGKPVTVSGVALSGTDAGNYSVSQPTGLAADITAKGLTISGASANNKVYNGDNTATVDFTGASLNGVESGDTVAINSSGYSATFNTKNVGNGKPVTVSGVALSGADAGNYTVSQPSGLTANITPKGLTISGAAAQNKVYDGSPSATVDLSGASLTGAESGDTVGIASSGHSASFNNKNRGNGKPVNISGVALTGADAGNYTVTPPSGLTADVTPKSVTGSFNAANKVYNGNSAATVTSRSLNGEVTGDDVSLSGGSASFANPDVGNGKTVTLAGAVLDPAGADVANYTLASVGTDTANITTKSVTGSFTAADKDFDGTTAATITGRSLSGAIAGDAVSLIGGTATFGNASPGVDKFVSGTGFGLGGADAGNYSLASVGTTTATINQRPPAGNEPPTEEDIQNGAEDKLGGGVKPAGLDFGGMAFGFAPDDQGKKLDAANQALFALGCIADCDVSAGKTIVLTTAGASTAATKKIKLKTQNLTLDSGELGVVKLKLTKKQKKAIKKAKKAKLVVKTTVTSAGDSATAKKTYKLKT